MGPAAEGSPSADPSLTGRAGREHTAPADLSGSLTAGCDCHFCPALPEFRLPSGTSLPCLVSILGMPGQPANMSLHRDLSALCGNLVLCWLGAGAGLQSCLVGFSSGSPEETGGTHKQDNPGGRDKGQASVAQQGGLRPREGVSGAV